MPHHPDSKKPNHKNTPHKGDLVRQFIVQPKKERRESEIAALLIALSITTHYRGAEAKPNKHRLIPHKPTLEQIKEIHVNNALQLQQK